MSISAVLQAKKGLVTRLVHLFEPRPEHWDIQPSSSYKGPYIVLIHGYKAASLMERHWFSHLKQQGFQDIHLFSNHEPVTNIVTSIKKAHLANRPLVIFGYSQGAFQVYKLARALDKSSQTVDLMVTIGAGGMGRIHPSQWLNRVRKVPKNVTKLLNFFAPSDYKGSDPIPAWNYPKADNAVTRIENTAIDLTGPRVHLDIARATAKSYLPDVIREQIVSKIDQALTDLSTDK